MYKERLKEYIERDPIYQDWKSGKLTELSDFDKFCIVHVEDIQTLLKEVEVLQNKIVKAIEYIKEQGCYDEDNKGFWDDLNYYAIPKLFEILKGSDVDE